MIRGTSRISCSIVYRNRAGAVKSAVKRSAKAVLVRNGRTYAKGRVGRLAATRTVARGRYTLRIGSGKQALALKVTVR